MYLFHSLGGAAAPSGPRAPGSAQSAWGAQLVRPIQNIYIYIYIYIHTYICIYIYIYIYVYTQKKKRQK